ncbi:MAG: toll/interleukin-1 receptor domain-containing protein [Desulfobaccales bacterium]
MKIFLSYSNADKELASKVKRVLESYNLEVFLAHDDIEPSAEWIDTILAELKACDIFIPILTDNFDDSNWTDQESGIAFAFNKLIVPLKVTVDPHGFISRFQALKLITTNIKASLEKLIKVLGSKPVIGDLTKDALINKFADSWSFDNATANTELLLSINDYNSRQLTDIIRHTIANAQINHSFRARDLLREFATKHKKVIEPLLLKAFYEAIE